MAPTEILARQHYERLAPLAKDLRLRLLTGRDRASERRATLAALAAGEVDIVVGTHALFQEAVVFADLGVAVVDEQHRFGVHQRLALGAKGAAVDILVMTATPIPRTLALTCFGDMDVSVLDEKPAGAARSPPASSPPTASTRWWRGWGARSVPATGSTGSAPWWRNPSSWISPPPRSASATCVTASATRSGSSTARCRGRTRTPPWSASRGARRRSSSPPRWWRWAVDVPEATIMVIEHAERFGLAQLHQLRGRVGRGSCASTCLLLYRGPLGQVSRARLEMMRETEDGFRIAEEDLRLRGEGEVLGTRQSVSPPSASRVSRATPSSCRWPATTRNSWSSATRA